MPRFSAMAPPLFVSRAKRSVAVPALAILLAVVIFAIDTLTPLDTAVAVLYVAVVMLLADMLTRSGILALGGLCIVLTLFSFFLMHDLRTEPEAVMRAVVSILAISLVTLLSHRNRRASDRLRDQAALLDLTHDAILVRDVSDTILYWSRGAEALYGWTHREAIGRRTTDLLKTVFPGVGNVVAAELLESGRWEGELRQTRKDGSSVIVSSRWSLHSDERGRPVATMETNNDISARKRSEDELLRAQAELAHVARVATLGQLMASIAHEINQPLAAVVTNGEACLRWLGRAEPDVGEAKASVQRMIADGRRASDVVARLRAMSRRDDPLHVPLRPNDVVEEALALIERELARHRVELELELAPDLPEVEGDRVQLQQVVINLAMNAAQAMASSAAPRLVVRSGLERDETGRRVVSIEVRDNGFGADPTVLRRLFEPFFSSKPDGMGLGLSICRSIIEVHAGRIEAVPNAGDGLTFRVQLPALKEATS